MSDPSDPSDPSDRGAPAVPDGGLIPGDMAGLTPSDGIPPDDRLPADTASVRTGLGPSRPGLGTFTIEGRAAPALFVIGWLATILGGGILFIGYQAARSTITSVLILGGLTLISIGLISAAGSQAIERRARGAVYAGPSPFLLLAAAVAVGSTLASIVLLPVRLLGLDTSSPVSNLVALAVIQLTYLGLTQLLVVGTGALSWADMGIHGGGRRIAQDVAWGAMFALPVIAVTVIVAGIVSSITSAVPESPLPATGSAGGLLLNLVGGAILVPMGEELLFRGVATTAWARIYGPVRAIVQGGLFFAVVHVLDIAGSVPEQALALASVAFVTRIPVALTLGWIFEGRKSLWASIGLHGAFNGILLILAETVRG